MEPHELFLDASDKNDISNSTDLDCSVRFTLLQAEKVAFPVHFPVSVTAPMTHLLAR